MRGTDEVSGSLFSYVDLDERIPAAHPLRKIRQIVNDALASLDAEFDALYTKEGRPSIAPERLIRASLLQMLFSIRSERQLMEQMDYNLLFRWFVGLGIDDPVWVPTVFTKNRDRLLTTDMSRKVMAAILAHPEVRPLLSDEHFSVDGTLVKAWASMKSFQPKESAPPDRDDDPGDPPPPPPADETSQDTDQKSQQTETQPMPDTPRQPRNAEVNFRGEKRSNATHASVTDPDARLYKKAPGAAAVLCFMGHTLMENRNGLVVQAELTHADGHGERKAALEMIERHSPGSTRRLTLAADKGYDSRYFVACAAEATGRSGANSYQLLRRHSNRETTPVASRTPCHAARSAVSPILPSTKFTYCGAFFVKVAGVFLGCHFSRGRYTLLSTSPRQN